MHIICDFDDTLTNTTKYWNFWLDKLAENGVDRKEAEEAGTRMFAECFTLHKHMSVLGVDELLAAQLLQEMEEHVSLLGSSYTFEDVLPFLNGYKDSHSFSLLTYGDETNQKWRVKESGLAAFFSPINVAGPNKHKVEHLAELLESTKHPIVFVDDSPNELNPVVNAGLPVKLYRIVRPGAKHDYIHERDGVAWTRISTLNEIEL